MGSYTDTIIVPYDFTEKANCAVKHAAIVAKNMNAELVLLHIVKKESQQSEFYGQLESIAEKIKAFVATVI